MSYHDRLETEILAQLDTLEATGQVLNAAWITHAICNQHVAGLAENDHAEMWRYGGHQFVRGEVRRVISKRHGDNAEQKKQRVLPGFEHLQSHYMINRDGEDVGVPVYSLTNSEIDAKAEFYEAMGTACYAHAEELRRFKLVREAA